jgi:ABC-type methionine transport system permease subunit
LYALARLFGITPAATHHALSEFADIKQTTVKLFFVTPHNFLLILLNPIAQILVGSQTGLEIIEQLD